MAFQKAQKKQAKLRLALIGPSGSGKTYTALAIASGLGARVAVIDSERKSASKYADRFGFDVEELETFHPQRYIDAIKAADAAGYDVLVIDSLSHAWSGKEGALELVDAAKARSKSKDGFGAWREITPLHQALVDAILRSSCHVIATMRVKTEWVLEKGDDGKNHPKKLGLQPVQRDGMEYEFDLVADMDEAEMVVTKSRVPEFAKAVIKEPSADVGRRLLGWLENGAPVPPPQPVGRVAAIFGEAKRMGWPTAEVKAWVAKVLGAEKPSAQWTPDDCALLEESLRAEAALSETTKGGAA